MEEDNFYKKSTEDDNSESDNNLSTILPDQSKINLEVLDTLPRKKNTTYLIIFFSVTVLAVIYYFFIRKDIITIVSVYIGLFTLLILGFKNPHKINVQIENRQIYIGQKTYSLNQYQSFYVKRFNNEGILLSLRPVKRFVPSLDMYLVNEDQLAEATDYLSKYLAYGEPSNNFMDTLLQWLGI